VRKYRDQVMYSPSDLVAFLGCRVRTQLDRRNLDEKLLKTKDDSSAKLISDKGLEHEAEYLNGLKAGGGKVIEIPNDYDTEPSAGKTRQAMVDGADVVFQATFFAPPWGGQADFVERCAESNGEPAGALNGYEVVDTKLARTPSPKHVLQIAAYSDYLAGMVGEEPTHMHLVLGDKSRASFRVDDYRYYYRQAVQAFDAFMADGAPERYPEPNGSCGLCHWRERCEARWVADDHLSQVAGITRSQIHKLVKEGVLTLQALAESVPDLRVRKLAAESFTKLRAQAALQLKKRHTGQDHHEILATDPGRGFERMPQPDAGDLFFDMEGDPLYEDGLEYLFGFWLVDEGEGSFREFWGHDHEEEKVAFEQAMDFMVERLQRYPGAFIYHYNHYEVTALKRLAMRYGTREDELDDLLRQQKFIDLYKVVREGIRVSEPSYSLKNLETFYMEKRAGDVQTAAESIVIYNAWREKPEQHLLQQIADYNEIDCISTLKLRDWLMGLRPADRPFFVGGEGLTDEKKQRQKEAADAQRELQVDLRARGNQEMDPADWAARGLVALLIGFHRREDKPKWWAHFERREKDYLDLLDDMDCLAGLVLDPQVPAVPIMRSKLHTYNFAAQQTKLHAGSRVIWSELNKKLNPIHSLDIDRRQLQLKFGNKMDVPTILTLIPNEVIDNRNQIDAVRRYAAAVQGTADLRSGPYAAISSVLLREPPRVVGQKAGQPILHDGESLEAGVIRAVSNLQESHLFIQGPPGAGKTYISSKAIVALLGQGKRVGVSSNSHKAINNLLKGVEESAAEVGLNFSGVKRSDKDRPETHIAGTFIRDIFKPKDMDAAAAAGDAQLVAGTVYHFAREPVDQTLDVLFVDEAGQVALANMIAMGTAAKNIVLVGDQMQLSQPIQGAHPGQSGLSALDYLLQGAATIPPESGIFLDNTWRMNPEVCAFISDAIYEGKLQARPENAKQKLELNDDCHDALQPAGIGFVSVEHEGCSQSSEEEAAALADIYRSLLQQHYVDNKGNSHAFTPADILVVTPYNAQVNLLKRVLGDVVEGWTGGVSRSDSDLRVGTVDKFQGQEGQVVLISMVTSGAEDLPRNIEFLFSKNRLNVAISRARCLSLVVASPRLLDIPCNTVEQMALVNTLCWVAHGTA
jgi:predicted RecB family nuclease